MPHFQLLSPSSNFLRENPHRLRGRVNPCRRRRYCQRPLPTSFLLSPTSKFSLPGRDFSNPAPFFYPPFYTILPPSATPPVIALIAQSPISTVSAHFQLLCSYRPLLTFVFLGGISLMAKTMTAIGGLVCAHPPKAVIPPPCFIRLFTHFLLLSRPSQFSLPSPSPHYLLSALTSNFLPPLAVPH